MDKFKELFDPERLNNLWKPVLGPKSNFLEGIRPDIPLALQLWERMKLQMEGDLGSKMKIIHPLLEQIDGRLKKLVDTTQILDEKEKQGLKQELKNSFDNLEDILDAFLYEP